MIPGQAFNCRIRKYESEVGLGTPVRTSMDGCVSGMANAFDERRLYTSCGKKLGEGKG